MSFLAGDITKQQYPHQWIDALAQALLFFATLLLPVFVLPWTRDALDLPKLIFLAAITLISILLWMLRGMLARELYLRRTVLDIPMGIFLALCVAASILSVSPSTSWLGRTGNFVLHTGAIASFAIFWWLMVQYIRSQSIWERFLNAFLFSGVMAALLYLFRTAPGVKALGASFGFNTVSQLNSMFGIFMALIGTLGIGLLLDRSRTRLQFVLPGIAAAASVATLFRLGFGVAWLVFAVGLACLLLIGTLLVAETRVGVVSAVFFLFLLSLVFVFVRTPNLIKESLPTEVALGVRVSWDMSMSSLLSGAKSFLVGSGPGTYAYIFSAYRPEAFNTVSSLWTSRFYRSFNVPFSFLGEIGVLGFLSFVFIILFHVGTIVTGWLRARSVDIEEHFAYVDETAGIAVAGDIVSPRRIPVFVVASAWFAATVGLCLAYYNVVLWWAWWWLLAMSMLGLGFFVRDLIREHTFLLEVSPQYSLALSFGMILIFSAVMFLGVYHGRFYAAEASYTRGVKAGGTVEQKAHIEQALQYRPRYVEYRLALAALYFQEARMEADKGANAIAEHIASRLSAAVSEARLAAEVDPKNVEIWETLSLMYLNARALAGDANEWSREATKRAMELEPTNPVFHWRLGSIHEFAGEREDAEKEYRRAMALKQDYLPPYVSLSNLFETNQELDNAINIFQPVLPLLENDAEQLFNLGRLFYNRNAKDDADRAQALWLRAVELAPNYSNAFYSLGLLAERNGDPTAARQYFERVRDLNPGNPDITQKLRSL